MRILGPNTLEPGTEGSVRIYLPRPLPLIPGDRFIVRESGRSETIGGGEVLDVDPTEKASTARPDRSMDRVIRERGWVDADELERLTGERRDPDVDRWVVDPEVLHEVLERLRTSLEGAGPMGLELAGLEPFERAVTTLLGDAVIEAGRLIPMGVADPLADHPYVAALAASPFVPPTPDGVDRGELRELVRRGDIIAVEGIFYAASAIEEAAQLAARLLENKPEGFTVSAFREAASTTRKHAMPLLSHLDGTGVTRRRDDVRIAGPRLPEV
jgi:selenocysteine-specific elongation factor